MTPPVPVLSALPGECPSCGWPFSFFVENSPGTLVHSCANCDVRITSTVPVLDKAARPAPTARAGGERPSSPNSGGPRRYAVAGVVYEIAAGERSITIDTDVASVSIPIRWTFPGMIELTEPAMLDAIGAVLRLADADAAAASDGVPQAQPPGQTASLSLVAMALDDAPDLVECAACGAQLVADGALYPEHNRRPIDPTDRRRRGRCPGSGMVRR